MALNYKTGTLDEAMKVVEHEALPALSDYEKMKLAVELLKVSSLRDAVDAIKSGVNRIQDAVEMRD